MHNLPSKVKLCNNQTVRNVYRQSNFHVSYRRRMPATLNWPLQGTGGWCQSIDGYCINVSFNCWSNNCKHHEWKLWLNTDGVVALLTVVLRSLVEPIHNISLRIQSPTLLDKGIRQGCACPILDKSGFRLSVALA